MLSCPLSDICLQRVNIFPMLGHQIAGGLHLGSEKRLLLCKPGIDIGYPQAHNLSSEFGIECSELHIKRSLQGIWRNKLQINLHFVCSSNEANQRRLHFVCSSNEANQRRLHFVCSSNEGSQTIQRRLHFTRFRSEANQRRLHFVCSRKEGIQFQALGLKGSNKLDPECIHGSSKFGVKTCIHGSSKFGVKTCIHGSSKFGVKTCIHYLFHELREFRRGDSLLDIVNGVCRGSHKPCQDFLVIIQGGWHLCN